MIGFFVVSIEDKQSQRLSSFLAQSFFKDRSLDDMTIVGVNGGQLSAKDYFTLGVQGRKQPMSPGELGCSLSHINIYKKFLNSDHKFAIIFEDDAIIPEHIDSKQLCNAVVSLNLPSNFLLSLGGIQSKVCRKVRGNYIENKIFNRNILKVAPHFFSRVCCTFSYMIDRKMAKLLLAYHEKIRRADDWSFLFDFDNTASIYMVDLINHSVEQNIENSYLELERIKTEDIKASLYGRGLFKEFAKINTVKYKL